MMPLATIAIPFNDWIWPAGLGLLAALLLLTWSYRRSFARYPRLIPLLTAYPVNSSHAIRMYNVLAAALRRGGFDAGDTLRAITLMDCFVLGSALDVAAPEEPWHSGAEVGPEFAEALATGARDADAAAAAIILEQFLRSLA